ncbi:hypothetical protein BDZ97DRAFT_1928712 [Flammula alnicola]|nr:hypothetical protein BDZ97DRAFT_1928712 [Flammula alnicola]
MGKPRKKRQIKARPKSPKWQCETGSLPEDEDEVPSPVQPETQQWNTEPSEADEQPPADSALHLKQAKNARSPLWLPWQDRFLASEALKLRPFLEPRGKPAQDAWDHLAQCLFEDSITLGSAIQRSGPACRARFKKLLEAHKKAETRSLQKTGTDEQVDEHLENMTNIAALVDVQASEKEGKATGVKNKADKEQQAALELRDAAMMGVVPRQTLSDISQLDGATWREKRGQREQPQKRVHSPTVGSSDKENLRPAGKRRCAANNVIEKALNDHHTATEQRLAEARRLDEQRQQQLLNGFAHISDGINALADAMRVQMERDSEIRRLEAEARAKESHEQAELYRMMFATLLQKLPPSS